MPRVIISEPDKTPQPYRPKLDRIVTKIGRASDNDIILSHGSASTYHCKLKRIEGGFILVDNDSTNGIKFEDTRFSIIDLEDGMTVQIGDDIDLEFTLSDEEKETLAEEDFEPQQKASFPKPKKKPEPKKKPPIKDDDDVVVLEEAKPKKRSKNKSSDDDEPKSRLKTSSDKPIVSNRPVATSSNTGISTLIFVILAILCFAGGLAIRHYQDHKTFIFSK